MCILGLEYEVALTEYILTICLLISTKVVFNLFYQPIKSLLLGMKSVFRHPRFVNVWSQKKQI